MPRTLLQLGLTDRPALAAVRRRAGGDAALANALAASVQRLPNTPTPAILSTCERTELYTLATPEEAGSLADAFTRHASADTTPAPIDHRLGQAAVAHLFSIAAGLESRLIGEPHILGQVSRAAPLHSAFAPSNLLARLFQDAVACGRHARSVSGLDRLSLSCVDLALTHARPLVNAAQQPHAAVIGSGSLAREIAPRLLALGFTATVFARHRARAAETLPPAIPTAPLDHLAAALPTCSLIVAATSSTTPLISATQLQALANPLVVIDLGVPPNVEAEAAAMSGVRLITLDDLLVGHRRPAHVIAQARAAVNARAARWSHRWLAHATDEAAAWPQSTVA